MKNVTGKLAFITGGSEGIGKETAKELVKAGANVIVFSRSKEKLDAALKEIEPLRKNSAQKSIIESLDVTDAKQTESVVSKLMREHGTPDYLINCAGFARPGYLNELDLQYYH